MSDSGRLRSRSIETRDIARIKIRVADLHISLGILEAAAIGRLPWGLLHERERRGWHNEVEVACTEVEGALRQVRLAARAAMEDPS